MALNPQLAFAFEFSDSLLPRGLMGQTYFSSLVGSCQDLQSCIFSPKGLVTVLGPQGVLSQHSLSGPSNLGGLDPARYGEGMQGAIHTLLSTVHMRSSWVSVTVRHSSGSMAWAFVVPDSGP